MQTLPIEDPEAHRLAEAIARETGDTLTHVVTKALRERFERLQSRRDKATAPLRSGPLPKSDVHISTMLNSI
jgi:hypothetical protein